MIRVASMVRVLSYRTPRLPIIRFEVALEGMDVPNQRDHPSRPRHARSEWRLDLSDVVAFGSLGARCKGSSAPSSVDRNRQSRNELRPRGSRTLRGHQEQKGATSTGARRGARDEHGARAAAGTYKAEARKETVLEGFTRISGLIGGLLIGLSTVLLLLLNGRIAGIGGIVGGLLSRRGSKVDGARSSSSASCSAHSFTCWRRAAAYR